MKTYKRPFWQRVLIRLHLMDAVRPAPLIPVTKPWEDKERHQWERDMWRAAEPKSLRKAG